MALQATVLIPTHDHGPLLLHSARSALAQTVEDLEVFVVGDGVPDATREVVAELKSDDRVRFFDNPKGPRHGEAYRHVALQQARGRIVCYLSDDDLWLPDHVETMRGMLQGADFAGATHVRVDEHSKLRPTASNLALPYYRNRMLSGTSGVNRVPLSCGAHTFEAYQRLPHGWRASPPGASTDLHMWQQFLADPGCRAVSAARPTVIQFQSTVRRGWTPEERLDEFELWSRRVADPEWRGRFYLEVLDDVLRTRANSMARNESRSQLFERRLQTQQQKIERLSNQVLELRRDLQNLKNSRTWRLLDGLNRTRARVFGA